MAAYDRSLGDLIAGKYRIVGTLRVPRDLDHRFRGDPIGHSTGSRSPVPREADHLFHGKPITCSTGSRSPVPREADHSFHGKSIT
jgi:hypothetical protein